jgi:hypothetical protein
MIWMVVDEMSYIPYQAWRAGPAGIGTPLTRVAAFFRRKLHASCSLFTPVTLLASP